MNGDCFMQDDFSELRPHLLEADMVVFVTPMYYFGFSSQLKAVIDRFYAINGKIKGAAKQSAFIMVYANSAYKDAEAMRVHYSTLADYLGWRDMGSVIAPKFVTIKTISMKRFITVFVLGCLILSSVAQAQNKNRTDLCKENYTTLFGGEALTGKGTDPEFMAILQKFIFGEVFAVGELDHKTRELITCTVLTTMQTLPQLKSHAAAALNVGVTPVELREAVYQCAPFIGFPRTLNAIGVINEVFREKGIPLPLDAQGTTTEENRYEKGFAIQNPLYGNEIAERMADVPGGMGADVARFLTEYCFGDIYTRNGLDVKTRELLIYCILTTLEADSQLQSHTLGNMKLGTSKETLVAAVIQCLPYVGFPPAMKALNAIKNAGRETVDPTKQLVRLSKIEVDPLRLVEYNAYLKEEIEASMRLEPGVLTLYATAEKENPNKVTILEIYADEEAYRKHIQTPHFQKYKQGTLDMVKSLELVDSTPLILGLKIK